MAKSGYTNFNIDQAKAALTNLQTEAPQENELNNIFVQGANELRGPSTQHDGFMDSYIAQLEPGGELYSAFDSANQDYLTYVGGLTTFITEAEKMEQGGNVDPTPATNPAGSGGPSPSISLTSPMSSWREDTHRDSGISTRCRNSSSSLR